MSYRHCRRCQRQWRDKNRRSESLCRKQPVPPWQTGPSMVESEVPSTSLRQVPSRHEEEKCPGWHKCSFDCRDKGQGSESSVCPLRPKTRLGGIVFDFNYRF